jgi:hypothetical protein
MVEIIFDVLKGRFQILSQPAEFPFSTKVKIIYATTALHYFISFLKEDVFNYSEIVEEQHDENLAKDLFIMKESKKIKRKRDKIAKKMWKD